MSFSGAAWSPDGCTWQVDSFASPLAMHVTSAAPAWLLLRLPADSSDFSTASAGC